MKISRGDMKRHEECLQPEAFRQKEEAPPRKDADRLAVEAREDVADRRVRIVGGADGADNRDITCTRAGEF